MNGNTKYSLSLIPLGSFIFGVKLTQHLDMWICRGCVQHFMPNIVMCSGSFLSSSYNLSLVWLVSSLIELDKIRTDQFVSMFVSYFSFLSYYLPSSWKIYVYIVAGNIKRNKNCSLLWRNSILPNFPDEKLKHREAKWFAQSHTDSRWQRWD